MHTKIAYPHDTSPSKLETRARVLAVFKSLSTPDIHTMSSCNYVLDPGYPALEPSPREYCDNLFGWLFGVPCQDSQSFAARRLSNIELLPCYSIPQDMPYSLLDGVSYETWLDDHMQYA